MRRYRRSRGVRYRRAAQGSVYRNAFSKSGHIKIRDGRCKLSSGIAIQQTRELVNDSDATMHILLVPGLKTAAFIAGAQDNSSLKLERHAEMTFANGALTQNSGQEINDWRLVSAGMRVRLTNNNDENDGWWEMIRTRISSESKLQLDNEGFFENGTAPDIFPFIKLDATLIDHPTYRTGSLKTIGKKAFQLHPHMKNHPFHSIRQTIKFVDGVSNYDYNPLLDSSYDVLYLRIHARPSTSNATRLLLHTRHNLEVVYDESNVLARYMSSNPTAMNIGTLAAAMGALDTVVPETYEDFLIRKKPLHRRRRDKRDKLTSKKLKWS